MNAHKEVLENLRAERELERERVRGIREKLEIAQAKLYDIDGALDRLERLEPTLVSESPDLETQNEQ